MKKTREEELNDKIEKRLKEIPRRKDYDSIVLEGKAELKGIQEGKAEADFEIKALKTSLKEAQENCKDWVTAYKNEVNLRKNDRKKELEFLKKHLEYVKKARKDVPGLQPFQYPIEERIKQLEKIKEDE